MAKSWLKIRRISFFALSLGLVLGTGLVVRASSITQDQDKKDEKKDEKKGGLSLKPTRKIEFTTSEGTWMSLDVSPDGQTIVFELVGDIYTLPIGGGEAKLIDGGMAFDSQPRFSPDGKWIAFLSDREGSENLFIMKPDGSGVKQLSKDSAGEIASPAWAPDSQYVYVSKAKDGFAAYNIWMYNIQGGSGLQVTKDPAGPTRGGGSNAMGVVPSPDGKFLYYAHKNGGFQYNAQFPLWQVTRRSMTTGEEDTIIGQPGSSVRPAISPDGKILLYVTRYETESGMRMRNLETGEDHWVKYPITRDDQESRFTRDLFPGYAFLPNGREIVYNNDGKICRLDITTGNEQVIPFTAKVTQELGPKLDFPQRVEEGPVKIRLIQDAVQSPDGTKLAFSALTHLYVMDLPSGQPHRLTSGNTHEYQPTWSPDGQYLAYTTWTNGGGSLNKISVSGGSPQELTTTKGAYWEPAWSPDGEHIVVERGNAYERESEEHGSSDLIWVSPQGGEAHLITTARGLRHPHFTNEKDRIYLNSYQGLMSVRYDGTDRRTLLSVEGSDAYGGSNPPASEYLISPDGHWVLTYVTGQLWLLPMPEVGGEPIKVSVTGPSVPVKKLTDIGADYFAWSKDGKTITWAIGHTFFREPLSAISFDAPKDEKKDKDAAASAEPHKFKEQDKNTEEFKVSLEVPRKTPHGTVVLRGANVITMKGDEIIKNADIVVENDRIKSIGAKGAVPAGAKVIDVTGKTITPGFIDTHAHWMEARQRILNVGGWSFTANLAYGVTSGLDVQTSTNDMFAYQDMVDAGDLLGLRAFSTGPGVFSGFNFQSKEEVLGVLTRYRDYYGTHNIKSYMVGTRKQRQFMVEAANDLQMMPTTEGGLDLKLNMTHAIDGFHGNEHTLPITPLYNDVVQLFAQSGIGETATLIVSYGGPWGENYFYETMDVHDDAKLNRFTPHMEIDEKTRRRPQWFRADEYAMPKHAAQLAKIVRAGGLVGIGSHGQLQGLGYHWELWMNASGMTPMEALHCATINGAKIIGRPEDLGSIEPGKLADLIVFDKNPLDDIHNTKTIHWVMKNGELFEGDTLDEVWPEQKKMEPMWFWDYDKPKVGPGLSYGKMTKP
jgi:Tol biopolymer transport system component